MGEEPRVAWGNFVVIPVEAERVVKSHPTGVHPASGAPGPVVVRRRPPHATTPWCAVERNTAGWAVLLTGLAATPAALSIGTLFGTMAGYFKGWTSIVFMRLTDMMMAFPALILAIALAPILRPRPRI